MQMSAGFYLNMWNLGVTFDDQGVCILLPGVCIEIAIKMPEMPARPALYRLTVGREEFRVQWLSGFLFGVSFADRRDISINLGVISIECEYDKGWNWDDECLPIRFLLPEDADLRDFPIRCNCCMSFELACDAGRQPLVCQHRAHRPAFEKLGASW